MSRRRGEFEHRTSIFEGAYRAWSHLGGCSPESIFRSSTVPPDLDPLLHPHGPDRDIRKSTGKGDEKRGGRTRDFYPYEPLPRSGLAHPYIQAVITPWLGPDADETDILHGLTTLRTWWQHRRKGESNSAKVSLGTSTMKTIVDGYTRHFFNLAHCLVVNDSEQPPRSLCEKMKIGQKNNIQVGRRAREAAALENAYNAISRTEETVSRTRTTESITNGGASSLVVTKLPVGPNGHPAVYGPHGSVHSNGHGHGLEATPVPVATETEYSEANTVPPATTFGDTNTVPIVYRSKNGDVQIAMKIKGITCGHCVKMIETVLRGIDDENVDAPSSPIPGLIDVIADQSLAFAVVRISQVSSAKRIAHEVGEVLAMIGYQIDVVEVMLDQIMGKIMAKYGQSSYNMRQIADRLNMNFETIPSACDIINWEEECTCPDSGVVSSASECKRHPSITQGLMHEFDKRGAEVIDMIIEESGADGRMSSSPVESAMPVPSSSTCFERPTKQQKRHHGMIDISPERLDGGDGHGSGTGNGDYRQVSTSTVDGHDQSSQHPHGGYYPEHFGPYSSEEYHGNGGYSNQYNNNMQYPYWQQQQQPYYNNHNSANGAPQHMTQDMGMMNQSNYYQHYQQPNGGSGNGVVDSSFPSTPYQYDHQGMNYPSPTDHDDGSTAQQSLGLVTSDSVGNFGNSANSINSYHPKNQNGWCNGSVAGNNNNQVSTTNEPFDFPRNIDSNVFS